MQRFSAPRPDLHCVLFVPEFCRAATDKPARESRAIFFVRLYFAKIAFGIIT
jgi:hypothetical protein